MTSRPSSGPRRARHTRGGPFVFAVALAALVVPAHAGAHGTLAPAAAPGGVAQQFELTVPNDRLDAEIVGVTLELPDEAVLESAEAEQPRWAVTSSETSVHWTGGPIESSTTETFAFIARLPAESGPQQFTLVESYDDGDGAPFPLTVAASAGEPGGPGGVGPIAAVARVLAAGGRGGGAGALAVALRSRQAAA